jgi:L-fuculose-phosphate aldolase
MDENTARLAVLEGGRFLVDKGLVVGTWGNLSLRFGERQLVITPTGSDYLRLGIEDLVVMDLETGEARGGKPSSEKGLHLEIYRRRPEIRAVVHTHSMSASTCAAARREVPPVLDDMAQLLGPTVRVADYALPGTGKMNRGVLRALSGRMAALMANHGAVAIGRSLDEALAACLVLEKACRVFIEAEFLGGAKPLNPVEAFLMHEVYLRKYSKASRQGLLGGDR